MFRTGVDSYITVTVDEIAEVQGGLQVTSKRDALPGRAPYLRVANVYRGWLDLSVIKEIGLTPAERQRTTLQRGDLLIVEGHGNPEEIGRCGLWAGEVANCVHQNHLIRVRPDVGRVNPVYAMHFLNSLNGRRFLLRAANTTSGLNTISTSTVKACPITVPPLELQQTFATRVAAVERLKELHREHLAKLDALFASLQHRAFKGEL
jgi:type I restriction enzyme S subunit